MEDQGLEPLLQRIAEALERVSPRSPSALELDEAEAYIWYAEGNRLEPVINVNRVDLDLLKGIDSVRDTLLANTRRFAAGLPANIALLWGARGMGKSSLVKAVHATVNNELDGSLILVEIMDLVQ